MDKVVSTNHDLFEEKGEPKRYQTEVLPLTNLKPVFFFSFFFYNTIQLYCLCVEKFAFWLVIYIKHSIHLTIKHSDSMKHGNKNGSDTRKMLNNNNVHTYARRHARAYPPPPHTHTVSLSHTHTHTNKTTRTVSQVKSPQKSIQMGKTDTADYGDSKLINKSFSLSIIKV